MTVAAIAAVPMKADAAGFIPVADKAPGHYSKEITVVLGSEFDGSIYYTTDGTKPTEASALYERPIVIEKDTIIKAVLVGEGGEVGSPVTLEYAIRPVGKDGVSAGDFIEAVSRAAGGKGTVADAVESGLIEGSQFRDYYAAITNEEAAVVTVAAYRKLGGELSMTKINAVEELGRIADLAQSNYPSALAACYSAGLMVGEPGGLFSTARLMQPTANLAREEALAVIERIREPEKRKVVTADGQVTRNTDLPENYKDFLYILETFPNEYYNMPRFYETQERSGETPRETGAGTKAGRTGESFNAVEEFVMSNEDVQTIKERAEEAVRLRLSVNYNTIGDDWVDALAAVSDFANPEIGDASPSYESWMKCARDYVEFVKEDKTITECAKVVCDTSSIYYDEPMFFARVYFKFRVLQSESAEDGWLSCIFDGLYKGNTGEWISGFVDVPMVYLGTAGSYYDYICSEFPIGSYRKSEEGLVPEPRVWAVRGQ